MRLRELAKIPQKKWDEETAFCNAEGIELTEARMRRLYLRLFPKPKTPDKERHAAEKKRAISLARKVEGLHQDPQMAAIKHIFEDMGRAMGKRAWLEIGTELGYRK